MKTYRVEVTETISYGIIVEAETEEEARSLAADKWEDSARPVLEFDGLSTGVDVSRVVEWPS